MPEVGDDGHVGLADSDRYEHQYAHETGRNGEVADGLFVDKVTYHDLVDALVDDDGGATKKKRKGLFYKILSSLSVEVPEADGGYLLIVGYEVAAGDEDCIEEGGGNEPYEWGM